MPYKNIFLVLFLLLFIKYARADHTAGGQIYYDYLGNNKYKITIEFYRDCNSATYFDEPIVYTIFNTSGSIYS